VTRFSAPTGPGGLFLAALVVGEPRPSNLIAHDTAYGAHRGAARCRLGKAGQGFEISILGGVPARSWVSMIVFVERSDGLVVEVASIPVGAGPDPLCVATDGRKVLVSNVEADTVSVIKVGPAAVAPTIPVGGSPAGIVTGADAPRAYVIVRRAAQPARLAVIDTGTGCVVGGVRLVGSPGELAGGGQGRLVFAADRAGGTVSVVDPGAGVVGQVRLDAGTRPGPMVLGPGGRRLYLSGQVEGEGILAAVDTGRRVVVDRLRFPFRPGRLALAPDGRRLYVTSPADGEVRVVDTTGSLAPIGAPIPVGDGVSGVAVSPDGRLLYVTDGKATVSIFGTADHLLRACPVVVGDTPLNVVTGPDGRHAFVSVFGSNTVAILTVTSEAR
jgi:YVTN family beta-propeller protein